MPENEKIADSTGFGSFKQAGGVPKITSVFDLSSEALEQIALWLEMRGLRTPITQILGFTQFTSQPAEVLTSETTTSTSYADLTTVGPQLTGLSDGKYLVLWTALIQSSNLNVYMGIKVNGTEASDPYAITLPFAASNITLSSFMFATLNNGGSNTVTARYKVSGATTGTFANRRLAVVRYANL